MIQVKQASGVCGKVLREYPQQGWPEVAPMDLSRPETFRSGTEAPVWPVSGRFEPLIGRRCPFSAAEGSRKPGNWSMDPVMLRKTSLPTVTRKNMTHTQAS